MTNFDDLVTKKEFKKANDEFRKTNDEFRQKFLSIDQRFDSLENRFDELMEFLRDNVATKADLARLDYNLRDYVDRKIGDLRGDLVIAGAL